MPGLFPLAPAESLESTHPRSGAVEADRLTYRWVLKARAQTKPGTYEVNGIFEIPLRHVTAENELIAYIRQPIAVNLGVH